MNEYFKVMIFRFSVIILWLVLLLWDYVEEYVTQIKKKAYLMH